MSLFDSASLVVTPNGYKEDKLYSIKPTDGSGDLVVTRATTATRVNSAGLVELVPYNLATYSEQFDNASWTKTNGSITANATTAPNGTTTADKFIPSSGLEGILQQNHFITSAQTISISVFAKASELNIITLNSRDNSSAANTASVSFNLTTGVISTAASSTGAYTSPSGTITNYGNGWYRLTLTHTTSISTTTRLRFITDSSGDGIKGIYLWGAQLVTGTSAKEYFPTTDRLNVPILDYTNSSCPSILVEPQRTNLALRSEEFDNATWTTNSNQVTISANSTTAPDGTLTADAILTTTVGATHYVQQRTGSATAGTTYTMSIYVKKLGYDYCRIETSNTATAYAIFRFSTKELTIAGGQVVANSGKVTEMSDGWFRIQMSILPAASATWRWWVECLNDVGSQSFVGDITKGLYVWGFQFEVGSNATSYIPTVASSVTRNADVISKTGISSLIGQTEGVMYFDLKSIADNNFKRLSINGGSYVNSIFFDFNNSNNLYLKVFNGGSAVATLLASGVNIANRNKIAIAYKNNDFSFYVNGTQVASQSSGSVPSGLANYEFSLGGNEKFIGNINASALWKTRLSNTELATLTTI